eukprot:3595128-Pyramimonas_sp.AAC.1
MPFVLPHCPFQIGLGPGVPAARRPSAHPRNTAREEPRESASHRCERYRRADDRFVLRLVASHDRIRDLDLIERIQEAEELLSSHHSSQSMSTWTCSQCGVSNFLKGSSRRSCSSVFQGHPGAATSRRPAKGRGKASAEGFVRDPWVRTPQSQGAQPEEPGARPRAARRALSPAV